MTVNRRGQITIPKRFRQALGITTGSKIAFNLDGEYVRLQVTRANAPSRMEDGPRILDYKGPRISIAKMNFRQLRLSDD